MDYRHVKVFGSRPFWIEVVPSRHDKHFLSGYEVGRDGCRLSPPGFTDRLVVIARSAIAWDKPAQVNRTYCELEEVTA